MKIEPVFLLDPIDVPLALPSRRAFLLFGAMFASGATLGAVCGYSVGGAPVRGPEHEAVLAWLRQLAAPTTPIEELVASRRLYLHLLEAHAVDDAEVWRGVDRLVQETIDNEAVPERRLLSRWLLQIVETGNNPTSLSANDLQALSEVR